MAIPQISVILPVYNAELYLTQAIDSILAQSFNDYELLIIDDGSTDNSYNIIKSYKDSRIKHKSRVNKGLSITLNELVAESSGKYLARMDADDICLPNRFEIQYQFLERHPKYVVCGSSVSYIDEKSKEIGRSFSYTSNIFIKYKLNYVAAVAHPTTMIRSEKFKYIGGYDNKVLFAEDFILWNKLKHVGKFYSIPEPLLKYRITPTAISSSGFNIPDSIRYNIINDHGLTEADYSDLKNKYKNCSPQNDIEYLKRLKTITSNVDIKVYKIINKIFGHKHSHKITCYLKQYSHIFNPDFYIKIINS